MTDLWASAPGKTNISRAGRTNAGAGQAAKLTSNYAAAAAHLNDKPAAANRKRTTAARDGDGDPARPADRADAPPHTHPAAAAYLIE